MVGWSRRNSEASERRRRWWATLNEEQRAEVIKREHEFDVKLLKGISIAFVCFLLFLLIEWAAR